MIGFVVRMTVIVVIMFGLNQLAWFSALAFGLAVVPAVILTLLFEMRLLAGGLNEAMTLDPAAARKGPSK
jgi:hypothetical protein